MMLRVPAERLDVAEGACWYMLVVVAVCGVRRTGLVPILSLRRLKGVRAAEADDTDAEPAMTWLTSCWMAGLTFGSGLSTVLAWSNHMMLSAYIISTETRSTYPVQQVDRRKMTTAYAIQFLIHP